MVKKRLIVIKTVRTRIKSRSVSPKTDSARLNQAGSITVQNNHMLKKIKKEKNQILALSEHALRKSD